MIFFFLDLIGIIWLKEKDLRSSRELELLWFHCGNENGI